MDVPKKGVSKTLSSGGEKARSNPGLRERVGIGRQLYLNPGPVPHVHTASLGQKGAAKAKGEVLVK